jgi:hypothetical protein
MCLSRTESSALVGAHLSFFLTEFLGGAMKIPVGWLVTIGVLAAGGLYLAGNLDHIEKAIAVPGTVAAEAPESSPAKSDDSTSISQEAMTLTGPLAKYVTRLNPVSDDSRRGEPNAADHVLGNSPVGTSRALVNQSFAVARIVDIPFELPAQAATPQVRGNFRASTQRKGAGATDANVEFLLLTQKEYEDFLNEQSSESVFSAEDAHEREVNVALPPTFGHRAAYHLVFRNNTPNVKEVVQANFRIDF